MGFGSASGHRMEGKLCSAQEELPSMEQIFLSKNELCWRCDLSNDGEFPFLGVSRIIGNQIKVDA